MKIAISAGHNVYANGYFDNGTRGHGRVEAQDVKKVVSLVKIGLRIKGYEILDVTPYNQRFVDNRNGSAQKNSHLERARRVNRFKPDLYLDIHENAGGGTGPETIVYSTKSKAYPWARKITNSIASHTGLTNQRGVRVRPAMWSVSLQPAPSIIVEGAFMDNKKDMDSITPEIYAKAIADVFEDLQPAHKGGVAMNREEIKKIVREELDRSNLPVSNWAKDDWEKAKEKGITKGNRPRDFATREEVIALINRSK